MIPSRIPTPTPRRASLLVRKHSAGENSKDRWLLTYADLITLLLALFVVMYSMSQLDKTKFAKISEALSGMFNARSTTVKPHEEIVDESPGNGPLRISKFMSMKRALDNRAYDKDLDEKKFAVEVNERGLVIHLMDNAVFPPAEAKLSTAAMELLDIVVSELQKSTNQIRVEGHTDNLPLRSLQFASNWELSTARATVVARYLIDAGGVDARRISAVGFGEYRPISPNNTAENRARNRRVDIVLLNQELSEKEPASALYISKTNSTAGN